jgi:membrane protease YdiL (CAAX protease family)
LPNSDFVNAATKDFGLGSIPAWASIALTFLFTATTAVLSDCATTMGEEIGWRGFLVPELAKRHSFAGTAPHLRSSLGAMAFSHSVVC